MSDIVLLLDPRWPSMVPAELCEVWAAGGGVQITDEVPAGTQTQLRSMLASVGGRSRGGVIKQLLCSTDEWHPQVQAAMTAGAVVLRAPSLEDAVYRSVKVMDAALERGEWEQGQTHHSLISYLHEEVAELEEAVADLEQQPSAEREAALLSELGDVYLQVLFHSAIAARRGAFDMAAVALSFVEKMRQRKPYLFDGSTGVVSLEEAERLWKLGKRGLYDEDV